MTSIGEIELLVVALPNGPQIKRPAGFPTGRLSSKNGCPSRNRIRTSSDSGLAAKADLLRFRTKSVRLGLIVGINAARRGLKYGLYYQATDGILSPLCPFPPVQHKPTLQEMAAKMEPARTLGETIRFLRMRQGLKQNELARKLRVCKTAVCQYEKGHTKPLAEHLSRLAVILGASNRELRSSLLR